MSRTLKVALAILASAAQLTAGSSRPITAEDCVRTRRIIEGEVQLSPDGTRVAYVVKAPDTAANRNDYELWVRDLGRLDVRENGRMLVKADGISGVRWTGLDRLMARVDNEVENGGVDRHLVALDTQSGSLETIDLPGKIEGFSASADGSTIVFSELAPANVNLAATEPEKVRNERGYPIGFGEDTRGSAEGLPEYELFLARRQASGNFDVGKLNFSTRVGTSDELQLRAVSDLDLSPDGRYLLLRYSTVSPPTDWVAQPYFELIKSWGTSFYSYVLGFYDIATAELRIAFNFPGGYLKTRWSSDSRFFSVVGPSPFGTEAARRETAKAQASGYLDQGIARFVHVFTVDPVTGSAKKMIGRESSEAKVPTADLPLVWERSDGPVLVRADAHHLAWMEMDEGQWRETSQQSLPSDLSFASSLQSNGRVLVGVHQTTTIPPDLFVLDLATDKWWVLTDLNPEYREIKLGEVEPISWTNRYGSKCAGFLIKPVGYQSGKRYPMVFLSAPPVDTFISDALYTTAYAPQPLAQAGFVVLISQYPRSNGIPRGRFPGEMSAAYNWMAMVESGIDLLVRRGLVDATNVGIAGFSRTSWLVDFTLTHSTYRFAAASSADGGSYTYGVYFLYNRPSLRTGMDNQVGGPPYGKTFRYWLEYAAPFNAQKVTAAVLMEYTHTAEPALEFFTALNRLGKAVELYRYPDGAHPLDTPFERIASLKRNVDWFRFWMQGREGKSPDYDPGQYDRWRALRSRSSAGHNFVRDATH